MGFFVTKRKKHYRFSELDPEHQREVLWHLDRKLATKTVWEFVPKFPAEEAAGFAWDISVMVHDSHVEAVKRAIKDEGILRPILIDNLEENDDKWWMEGIHRSIAANEIGLKTVPVLLRVE